MGYGRNTMDNGVETHGGYPAINVKTYKFAEGLTPEKFDCNEKDFERVMGYAWDTMQETFWDRIQDLVDEYLPGAKAYSEGRSGGWLVLHGLPDVETWDEEMIGKYNELTNAVEEEIKYLSSDEEVKGLIDANGWLEGCTNEGTSEDEE